MTEPTKPYGLSRFQPGDRARIKQAADIQVYIEDVTFNDVGHCHYSIAWWANGKREHESGISEHELEPLT